MYFSVILLSFICGCIAQNDDISKEYVKLSNGRNTNIFYDMFYELELYYGNCCPHKSVWYIGKTNDDYYMMNNNHYLNVTFSSQFDGLYDIVFVNPLNVYSIFGEPAFNQNGNKYGPFSIYSDKCFTFLPTLMGKYLLYNGEKCNIENRGMIINKHENGFSYHYSIGLSSEYNIINESQHIIWPFDSINDFIRNKSKRIEFCGNGNYINNSSATITEIYTAKQTVTTSVTVKISNQTASSRLITKSGVSKTVSDYVEVNANVKNKVESKVNFAVGSFKSEIEASVGAKAGHSANITQNCINGCETNTFDKKLEETNSSTVSTTIEYTVSKKIEIKPFSHLRYSTFMNMANDVYIPFEVRRNVTVEGPVMNGGQTRAWNVTKTILDQKTVLKLLKYKYSTDFLYAKGSIEGTFTIGFGFTAESDDLKPEKQTFDDKGIGFFSILLIIIGVLLIVSLVIIINYYLITKIQINRSVIR